MLKRADPLLYAEDRSAKVQLGCSLTVERKEVAATTSRKRRSFGKIQRMRSGRYQASYVGPDSARHYAEHTYDAREDAEGWLNQERRLITWGQWIAPAARRAQDEADRSSQAEAASRTGVTLEAYGREWVDSRVSPKGTPLHPRTRVEYESYLDGVLRTLASRPIASITPADVARWHASHAGTPALRHKAYAFLKSVLKTAAEVDELIERNPCRVENATRKPRAATDASKIVKRLTHNDVRRLADLVQPRDRALVLLQAYCGIRTGEACALRRRDVLLGTGTGGLPFGWLTVERGVSSYDGQRHEGDTKTGAKGERVVPIPPHLVSELQDHLTTWAEPGSDGLLFPSTNPRLNYRTTQQINGHAEVPREDGTVGKRGYGWYHAREAAGVPGMHLHWLRHWAATLWDEAGTPEGLRRAILGHAQQGMTGHYTHPDTTKASPYALRVSELAGWVPSTPSMVDASPQAGTASDGLVMDLLSALDTEALAGALGALTAEQVADLLPSLPAARVAAVLGLLAVRQ